jgi:iron complex transport system permease protein
MKKTSILIAASFISLIFIFAAASIGNVSIHILETARIIFGKIFGYSLRGIDAQKISIVWEIRLPRVLLAFLTGGCVSASGAVVQSLLKNPLASPYTMGISSGVALGAGVVIISGLSIPLLGGFTLPAVGFLTGLLTVFAVTGISSTLDRAMSDNTVILFGMVFSLFANAVLTAASAFFSDSLKRIVLWQMGSFSLRGWSYVTLILPFCVVGIAGVMLKTRELDLLTFGDEYAKSAGVETEKVKKLLFVHTAILTGGAVALSGTIGFVDLVAPHIARRIIGSRHRLVIPLAFATGGCLMAASDLLARTLVPPSEIPVGAITALIGAPFFVFVYFTRGRRHA